MSHFNSNKYKFEIFLFHFNFINLHGHNLLNSSYRSVMPRKMGNEKDEAQTGILIFTLTKHFLHHSYYVVSVKRIEMSEMSEMSEMMY
ncbi:hypothetical protein EYC80_003087 [Monilinia laxa]|uniref:Uncharacterized protein n=1 Tax=Monilinia laxa TaxID=61186 RepID=A0A5N6KCV1_MONLA|nr:hypothetical protein EYC80_003087 [Monilinia laxa]